MKSCRRGVQNIHTPLPPSKNAFWPKGSAGMGGGGGVWSLGMFWGLSCSCNLRRPCAKESSTSNSKTSWAPTRFDIWRSLTEGGKFSLPFSRRLAGIRSSEHRAPSWTTTSNLEQPIQSNLAMIMYCLGHAAGRRCHHVLSC